MSLYGLSAEVGMGNQMLSNVGNENDRIANQNTINMVNYNLAIKNEKSKREMDDYMLGGTDSVAVISGLRNLNSFRKKASAYSSDGSALNGWSNMARDNLTGGSNPQQFLKGKGAPIAEGSPASDTFTDGSVGGSDLRGTFTFDAPSDTSGRLAKLQSFGKVSDKVSSGTTSTLDDIVGPEPEPEAELGPGQSDPRASFAVDDVAGKNPVMPTEKLGTSGATSDGAGTKNLSVDAVASVSKGDEPSMTGKVLGALAGSTDSATADLIGKSVGNAGAIIDGVEGVDSLIRSKGKSFFDPGMSGVSKAGEITQMAGAGLDFAATALPFLAPLALVTNIAGGILDSVGKVDDDAETAKGLKAPGKKNQAPLASSQGWADMGMVASAQSDPVRQIASSSAF